MKYINKSVQSKASFTHGLQFLEYLAGLIEPGGNDSGLVCARYITTANFRTQPNGLERLLCSAAYRTSARSDGGISLLAAV